MSSENEYPDEYPHNNEWRISMGFDPIELPAEFMSVYGEPLVETEVQVEFPTQKLKKRTSPEKKHKPPKKSPTPALTNPPNPVADYIQNSKKPDQHTLTQLFNKQNAHSDDSESDDDFVAKKPRHQRKTPTIVSPNAQEIKRRSKAANRKLIPDLAQFGDLVTSTAKELNHPDYTSGRVNPGYILFGVVRGGDKDTVLVSWNKPEPIFCKNTGVVNHDTKLIEYADRTLVRVVAKSDDQQITKMNNFLRAAIYHEFFFKKGVGWTKHKWV